jgi:1,4-alpha-glucan branching enzyme
MLNKFLKTALFPVALACIMLFSPTVEGMDFYQIFDAGPPEVTSEGILFTYKPVKRMPRYIMVSGEFDNWQTLHMMTKNDQGVFAYLYDEIQEHTDTGKRGIIIDRGQYSYRYLVDGVWITDPLNMKKIYDQYGTELSYFTVKKPVIKRQANPIHIGGTRYVFYFENTRVQSVYLVGDFNNWNPYSHPMKSPRHSRSGIWEIEIDLPEGQYSYRFIVDGKHRVDPLGRNIMKDRFSRELTTLLIPLELMVETEKPSIFQLQ